MFPLYIPNTTESLSRDRCSIESAFSIVAYNSMPIQQMQIQKKKGKLKATDTFERILSANRDLRDYFARKSSGRDCVELAVELLREAIAARNAKSKDKHYNVAYIKHNRFLSPSQKQAVTPKVTEIIPLSPERVLIYAKPKGRQDSQLCCERHNSPQCCGVNEKPKSNRRVEIVSTHSRNPQICSKKSIQTEPDKLEEQERYLSPKAPTKPKKAPKTTHKLTAEKPKEVQPKKELKSPNSHKGYNLNIESNCRTVALESERRVTLPSPKICMPLQRYDNVQSKIKFLIERDKRSKKVERQLEEQTKKIDELEERQEKLLVRQYQQEKDISRQQQRAVKRIKVSSSESSDDEISSKLKLLKQRITHADQHFYSKALQPHSRLEKVSTQPIYSPSPSSRSSSPSTPSPSPSPSTPSPSEEHFDF